MKINEEKVALLQEIINEGIGDRTRRAFALEVGIAPEHLSRLMKKGYKLIPNEKTLIAFSQALPNTSKEELLSLFELEELELPKSPIELATEVYKDLKASSELILNLERLYSSLEDFVEELMLFNTVNAKTKYSIEELINADKKESSLIKINFKFQEVDIQFFFALVFSKLKDESIVILDVLFDKESINEFGLSVDSKTKYPFCVSIHSTSEEMTEGQTDVVSVIKGLGFYVDDKEGNIHLNRFIDEFSNDLTEDYSYTLHNAAEVMKQRTSLPFEYKIGIDKDAIILQKDSYSQMDKEIVKKYAKLLGVNTYGFLNLKVKESVGEDELFNVD